jgi:hypothetical protein
MEESFLNKLNEMSDKAKKYDNMSGRYIKIAEKLDSLIMGLQALRSEIDPYTSMSEKSRLTYKEKCEELRKIIFSGTQVDLDFIMKTYPDIPKIKVYNLMTTLLKDKRLEKVKRGGHVWIISRKEE